MKAAKPLIAQKAEMELDHGYERRQQSAQRRSRPCFELVAIPDSGITGALGIV